MNKRDSTAAAFGRTLKELRQENGLTGVDLAMRAGFDCSYPSRLECGERCPTLDIFVAIARATRLEPEVLFARFLRELRREQAPPEEDNLLVALLADAQEAERLSTLTHPQLVAEVLCSDFWESLAVREMMTRLDPRWMELTPAEKRPARRLRLVVNAATPPARGDSPPPAPALQAGGSLPERPE